MTCAIAMHEIKWNGRTTFIGHARGPSEAVPAPTQRALCARETRCSTRIHFERLNELFCEGVQTQETKLGVAFLDNAVKHETCPACGRVTSL